MWYLKSVCNLQNLDRYNSPHINIVFIAYSHDSQDSYDQLGILSTVFSFLFFLFLWFKNNIWRKQNIWDTELTAKWMNFFVETICDTNSNSVKTMKQFFFHLKIRTISVIKYIFTDVACDTSEYSLNIRCSNKGYPIEAFKWTFLMILISNLLTTFNFRYDWEQLTILSYFNM